MGNQNKLVVLLRGVSGAGKSTMVKNLVSANKDKTVKVVSADHWFERSGTYQFDPSQLGKAHGNAQSEFVKALHAGTELVIVDNTNIKLREMKFYIDEAKNTGYDWQIYQLETANPKNAHGVPDAKVASMKANMDQATATMPDEWKRHMQVFNR